MLKVINRFILSSKYEKVVNDYVENQQLIWGLNSNHNLEGNIFTINDIDVIFDKKLQKYYINIETIYYNYDYDHQDAQLYMKKLLDKFTEWMKSKKYNTNYKLHISDIFTKGYNINTKFDTLEELYAFFKILVNGFCIE